MLSCLVFILFCFFCPTDNPDSASKKQEHSSQSPTEMQELLNLIVHAKRTVFGGNQLALLPPSCPLNQENCPLRTLNAREGSSLTPLP